MSFKAFLAVLGLFSTLAASLSINSHDGSSADFIFDETAKNYRCEHDYECNGLRKCSAFGWCQDPPK